MSTKPSTLDTYGSHIDASYDAGNFIMFGDKPDEEERAMLLVPFTYCPNVADHLDESNWSEIERLLSEVDPDGNDHDVASFGSWATPYELMRVRPGTECERVANDIAFRLEQYPVLNEDDLSERETDAANDDLLDALRGMTIVVNGVEAVFDTSDGHQPEGTALEDTLWEILTENETPESIDKSDVERVLRDELGFTYDEAEYTWVGTLEIKPEPTLQHSFDADTFCAVCCAPGAGCSFAADTDVKHMRGSDYPFS